MKKRVLLIVSSIVGMLLVCLVAAYLFNPSRVTPDQIVAAPRPADISLGGQDFLVQPVKLGHSNVYFIATENGYIMVDAGVPNLETQIHSAFEVAGVDSHSVQLIILTHGHMDHVGSIAYAKKITGGEVLCHQAYAQALEKGVIEPATAQSFTGRFLNFMTGLLGTSYEGVKPDIILTDEYDLHDYGLAGKVIHTPGHSPSSLSITLEDGEALIGDMVREEEPGKIGAGMYYEDETVLIQSLRNVAAFEPKVIYLSHGSHIDNLALRSAIETVVLESGT